MFHIQIRRVSAGTKDSAIDRLRYIARTNRYAGRGDTVRHIRTINMPTWVTDPSGSDYWRGADSPSMRTNGRLLFTIEIALPRVLPPADQDQLVLVFARLVSRISTGRHDKSNMPCTYAIHEGIRKDDYLTGRLPNPHAHILLSVSINDGVQRSSQIWFRRADSRRPEESGAARSKYVGTKRWLLQVRKLWARVANAALKRAGFAANLDHRSNRKRGILTKPTVHVGPKGSYLAREGLPTSRTRRNLRIKKLNDALDALQARHVHGKAITSQVEKEALEKEAGLQWRKAQELAQLEAELALHPFAGEHDEIATVATALVFSLDISHPAMRLDSGEFQQRLLQAQRDLGTGWLAARIGDRVWLMKPPSDDVLVIGPGFVVTDGATEDMLIKFLVVIRAMKFEQLFGVVQPEIRDRVVAMSEAKSISVAWNISMARKPLLTPAP